MKSKSMMALFYAVMALVGVVPMALAQAPAAVAEMSNRIEDMEVSQQGGSVYVRLTLKEPPASPPPSFSVATPPRIAFDFRGTANGLGRTQQDIGQGELRSANIVQAGDRTRLVLNLTRATPYEARVEGRNVIITLSPIAPDAVASTPVSQALANFAAPKAQDAAAETKSIRDITFRRGKDGEARIAVQLSSPDTGIDIRRQGENLVVEFLRTSLPEHLRRRSDVTDFATPVTSMTAQPQGDNVRLLVAPTGLWEHNAYQADDQFVLEVRRITEDPSKLVQGSGGGFKGEKLSLNFQNIDVRSVLQVVADFTDLNIVTSDRVQGTVTVRLMDVPWDQALQVILDAKGLSYTKTGNVMWIATPEEIEERKQAQYRRAALEREVEPVDVEVFQINYQTASVVANLIKGEAAGAKTTLQRVGDGAARNTPLAASGFGADTTTVQTAVSLGKRLLSERGFITAEDLSNKIFVTDVASSRQAIAAFLREIDIPPRQVLIEARIVEANKAFARDLGVRLGVGGVGGRTVGFDANGRPIRRATVGGGLETTAANAGQVVSGAVSAVPDGLNVNMPAPSGSGLLSAVLWNNAATRFLNLELSALESDGRGRIVSSPRVLTANHREASIEQGTEIAYRKETSSGATSVEFKKAVLSLKVTPQITPDGRVQLEVKVNKDRPEFLPGITEPAIATKTVDTKILVENGGTVVIGGIYEEREDDLVARIPLLGEVPLVGALFRNTKKISDRSELLIFITPRIVADSLTLR